MSHIPCRSAFPVVALVTTLFSPHPVPSQGLPGFERPLGSIGGDSSLLHDLSELEATKVQEAAGKDFDENIFRDGACGDLRLAGVEGDVYASDINQTVVAQTMVIKCGN